MAAVKSRSNTKPGAGDPVVAAVVPCYRERDHILDVLKAIGPEVGRIYVVDDACPDQTGLYVRDNAKDPRITV
ncbi:MAG: glycosyltransferase family 2 protein, partial [Rhodospirillaceae bacterium]